MVVVTEDKLSYLEELSARLPKVRSHDEFHKFNPENIVNSLILETKISRDLALDIAIEVVEKIAASGIKYLTGANIRSFCISVLAERGLEKESILYTRIGIPMYDITQTITDPTAKNSNANLLRNPETIAKQIHDEIMEYYTLMRQPRKLGDAHLRGDIYIKDRDYFYTRDYCASWDPRQFLNLGLAPDGLGGKHSSYAKPAKHALVAMNHAAIWLATAQCNFAGGQGFYYFNVFLAPYLKGLSKKKIKQAAQHFVFIMTQQYVARGGQIIFSSIDLTPGVPEILKDVPATKSGGVVGPETYGDYEEETQALFDAFMDVFLEGDGKGKMFNYPKPNLILKEEFMSKKYESSWLKAAELTIKYGLPYFENYLNWRKDIAAGCSSCCSHLWVAEGPEELEKFKSGNMVFGATQMVTPNFGRAAWLTQQFGNGKEEYFFHKLQEYLEMVKGVFIEKKNAMDAVLRNGNAPFYNQPKPDGTSLVTGEDRMYLIGTVGFNEMCEIMIGEPLHGKKGKRFALKVIRWLKKKAKEMSEETGFDIDITRTPAESAAGRLAVKDFKAYPGIRRYLRGTPDNPYYSNSICVDVAADISLTERIETEAMFHPFLSGGALTHIYMGDIGNIQPEAVWKLIRHIAENTLTSYFAFTRDLMMCNECGYMGLPDDITEDLYGVCPNCEGLGEIYSRITGYVQALHTWNAAKKQEFRDRRRYKLV
jgi:ribonucleoside-triphosphate reductase